MKTTCLPSLPLLLLAASCSSADEPPVDSVEVLVYGEMREVLREGRSHGRVEVASVTRPHSIGVGAMAGLAGEVTILDGRALVSRVENERLTVREARSSEMAALLVTAEVGDWRECQLPDSEDYDSLESNVRSGLVDAGFDPGAPTPIRITGSADRLSVHVVAGACPIADPGGPAPWRFDGPVDEVTLVGVYVEGAAGRLTHHQHSSHLHAQAGEIVGHLDDVRLRGVRLFLPAR